MSLQQHHIAYGQYQAQKLRQFCYLSHFIKHFHCRRRTTNLVAIVDSKPLIMKFIPSSSGSPLSEVEATESSLELLVTNSLSQIDDTDTTSTEVESETYPRSQLPAAGEPIVSHSDFAKLSNSNLHPTPQNSQSPEQQLQNDKIDQLASQSDILIYCYSSL